MVLDALCTDSFEIMIVEVKEFSFSQTSLSLAEQLIIVLQDWTYYNFYSFHNSRTTDY
jgi:hypothetical protein